MINPNEAKRDQIADFLRTHVDFATSVAGSPYWMRYTRFQMLPTAEQFADWLLAKSEYQSLQLGDWLGTTDGEIISTAVGMVIPPIYKPEYDLAVEGLKLAARKQHEEGRLKVIRGVFKVVGAGCGVGLIVIGVATLNREAA